MNEQQIRDALRGVAEAGGEPAADAAWDEVSRGIAANRNSRSRRVTFGGAVVAMAAAAAAFVVLVNPTDDDAVQVDLSDAPKVAPTERRSDDAVGSGARVPDHPMAVVVQDGDGQRLDLYDADTGVLLQRDLARSDRITNVSIEGAGLTYTEEVDDTARVRIMTYDRDRLPFTHTPYILDNARSGVGSGDTTAYVQPGANQQRDRIALWHHPTNTTRYLEWAPDEAPDALADRQIDDLAFSPDGTRLAFVASWGPHDIRVIDITATSLNESRLVTNGAADPAWTDLDGMLAVGACCNHSATGVLISISGLSEVSDQGDAVGPATFDPPENDAVDIAIDGGLLAVVSTDGTLEVGSQSGPLRPFAIDGTVVAVGL